MPMHLIYGRAGCGKTHYITDMIRSRLSENKRSVLVVPEQYTHIAEHKLLSAVGSVSPETVEVTSFNKMITRAQRGQGITNVLTPMAKSIIMADVISNTELKYFAGSAKLSGFSDLCLSLVGEFKKYCVSPLQLSEANDDNTNARLKLKIEDICSIYTEYIRRVAEMGFDSDDGAGLMAKQIADEWDIADTCIFFDEFTSFIPQELEIIKQLALKGEDVYITLCTDGKDDMLFAPIADTAEKLTRLCADSGIEADIPIILTENKKHSRELAFLEKNLFPYSKGRYDDDCVDINLFSAANPYEEVMDVSRRILKLCRGGMRFRDIGVICSDIGTYAPYIKPVFESMGISYFIDEKSPVLNHRIVSFVLNALDIYLNDYSIETVFSFLKSGFCDCDMNAVYALENYCLSTNMRKSTWLNDEKWLSLISRYDMPPELQGQICRVREELIIPLSEFHDKIKGRHSAIHMCRALYDYLVSIGLMRHIEERLKIFEEEQDVLHGEEYEKIWNVIVGALDALSEVMGEKTVNVKDFRSLLETAFSGYSIGFIPKSLDDVFIGNISRSKADDIKALFVLGANDGSFPSAAVHGELINDGDKATLAERGIELSADSKTRAFFERFFMYSTFTLPRQLLFISFSRSGSTGDTLRPSFVLSDIRRIFPDLVVESDILEDSSDFGQMEYITALKPTLEKMIEKITEFRGGGEISSVWFDVYDYFCRNFDFGTRLEKYYAHTNRAENISPELMREFISDEFYITISRLQRYRSCKFAYFMEYVLKLKDNAPFDITSMDTGTFVHGAIERLCHAMAAEGFSFETVTDEYIYEKIDLFIEEFIRQLTENSAFISNRKLYIIRRLRRSIFRCFKLICEHIVNSSFEPLGYEMRFDDNNIGCIEFDLGDGKKAKITGVIDRSDVYRSENGDYVRVIDYKTGSKEFHLSDVFYGLDIQLFVYLNALVDSCEGYKYGGALYFRIDDPMLQEKNRTNIDKAEEEADKKLKMRGLVPKEEEILSAFDEATAGAAKGASYKSFVELDKHLRRIISDLCRELAGGRNEIRPCNKQGKSPCEYCGYKSICRFDVRKRDNDYEYLEAMKDDEIWDAIGGENNVD